MRNVGNIYEYNIKKKRCQEVKRKLKHVALSYNWLSFEYKNIK